MKSYYEYFLLIMGGQYWTLLGGHYYTLIDKRNGYPLYFKQCGNEILCESINLIFVKEVESLSFCFGQDSNMFMFAS